MKPFVLIALLVPTSALAHPHIFVDVGLEVLVDEAGHLEAVKVTWAYDAFYSLLITEDYGLDADGDAVLTPSEEVQLTGFDMQWVNGFNGDLVAALTGKPLALSGPKQPTAVMREGRIVTTHLRQVEGAPKVVGEMLTLKPFDPTYYTAYDVRLAVKITGFPGCAIAKYDPDINAEMEKLQSALSELGRDQDAIEMGFPEVGESFASTVEVSCAPL